MIFFIYESIYMVKLAKKFKENFAETERKGTINAIIDEILSYFPFYFRYVINFFRMFIEKGLSGDLFYFVYLWGIFVIIKMYIRGRVIPKQELYYDMMV